VKKWLGALVGVATLLAGSAQAADFVLIHHSDGTDPFWPVVNRGAEDAAKALGDKLEIRHPSRVDAVEMAQLIETAIAQKPNGLIISIPDGDVIGPVIKKAVDAGIPVISINSGGDVARKFGVLFHVGQPEFAAGEGAGKRAKELGVTKHLCVVQEAANAALRERCAGYASALGAQPNVVEASNDPAEIKARASAALSANPDVNGILATGPHVCPPVHEAIVENGLEGKVHLSCFDLTPAVIDLIKSGGADYSVDQQQYLQGYLPVVGLDLYVKYGLVPGADVLSGPGFVTKDNADAVAALAGQYR
jgi:simple sugar transport system substrate-binding protein